MKVDIQFLKDWQTEGRKIAIYCAGRHGILFSNILKKCDITVDCFLDNNPEKWNCLIYDDIWCISPEYVAEKEDYIVLICIDSTFYNDILKSAKKNSIIHVANFNDVIDDIITSNPKMYFELIKEYTDIEAAELFYNVEANNWAIEDTEENVVGSDRIAVYTGVFGNYDAIYIPEICPANIDYFFVSDSRPEGMEPFQWLDAKKIIPDNINSPIKRNRYIKMHPHLLFPQYKYSIYIDGNISVLEDISSFIHANKTGVSVFMHPKRECIFYEGITIVNFRRVVAEDVCRQMERYLEEGMPLHYGMPEMPVIAREHMKPECMKIMKEWWHEFDTESQRDQLSFMYVMWKNGMELSDITSLGTDVRKCKKLILNKHYSESELIANKGQ